MTTAACACPVCGADAIKSARVFRPIHLPSGATENVEIWEDTCASCGMAGDFMDRNDEVIDAVLRKSARETADNLAGQLEAIGIKLPYIERILGIQQGTIRKWKEGKYPRAACALLKILALHPRVLADFDSSLKEVTE